MKLILVTVFLANFCFAQALTYNNIQTKLYKTQTEYDLEKSPKKVFINFWATWCTSCIEELPILEAMKADPKNSDIEFIAINVGDTDKKIDKFLKKYKFTFKMISDKDKSISKKWNVKSLPQSIIVEKSAIIRYVHPMLMSGTSF